MAVLAQRVVTVTFSGDAAGTEVYTAAANPISPGAQDLVSLAMGANTVTVPVVAGVTVTCLTIIPPAGNTGVITLKGVTGDTGVVIHPTDPTSLGIGAAVVSLVLNASVAIAGVRLVWN